MSSSKVLTNLNIRKYPSYESYKASTPGEDDLCVVDENGDLLLQVQTLPTASAAYENRIVQQKSNGYFYKCVSDGQDPATYSWSQLLVQPQPYVPDSLEQRSDLSTTDVLGKIVQYTGATDANYTNGYVYKVVNVPATATISQTVGSSLSDLTVDADGFISDVSGHATGTYALTYTDGVWYYGSGAHDISGYITYTGTPEEGDEITVEILTLPTTAWQQIDVQPGSGGSTYTAGTGISIDANNEISVADPVLVNQRPTSGIWANGQDTGTNVIIGPGTTSSTVASFYKNRVVIGANAGSGDNPNNVVIGANAKGRQDTVTVGSGAVVNGYYSIGVGLSATVTAQRAIAVGYRAGATATGAIQLGSVSAGTGTNNSDANTFKVANANGNYEIMSADGTVPTARLTKVNTTATLAAADWSSNTQTVTVSGVKADSVVFVSPAPASASDYASAGILCTAQAADSLTFTCTTTPSNAITVNVICM